MYLYFIVKPAFKKYDLIHSSIEVKCSYKISSTLQARGQSSQRYYTRPIYYWNWKFKSAHL